MKKQFIQSGKRILALLICAISVLSLVSTTISYALDRVQVESQSNAESTPFLEYFSGGGTWENLNTPNHWIVGANDVAYCLQHRKDSPHSSDNFEEARLADFYSDRILIGLQIILEYGYPCNTPSNLTEAQARYATANAIRFWLSENGDSNQYNFTNRQEHPDFIRAKSGYQHVLDFADELLGRARNQQPMEHTVTFSPNNLSLTLSGDYFVGTTTVSLSNCNGGYTLDTSGMPSGTVIEGDNGRNGDVLTIKIPSPQGNKNFTLKVMGMDNRVTANIFMYATDSNDVQNVISMSTGGYHAVGESSLTMDTPAYGQIKIIKTTKNNDGAVGGFQFEVRNISGSLIGTYTSDSSGVISVPDLQAGTYTVKEINLPSDFVEPSPNPVTVEVRPNETASVSFDNIKKRGVISVVKTNANPTMGGYSLAGAEFSIYNSDLDLVDTITTDASGRAQTKILPLGLYYVSESKAPTGFILDKNSYTARINGSQGSAEVVYAPDVTVAEQPQAGRINIQKSNSNTGMGAYSLAGAVFEVRNSDNVLVDTLTTDADGKAQSKDLPLGTYTVKEKSAPYGFTLNTSSYTATLEYAGQNVSLAYTTINVPERPQTGIIRLHKTNANPPMGDYDLSGAMFEVRNSSGVLVDTITTNSSGEAQSKELPLGVYTVREKTAPYGFVLNTNEYNPVLSYAGQDVTITYADVTVPENPQMGTMTVTKLDRETGTTAQGDSTLNGAVFEIYDSGQTKLLETLYCGKSNSQTSKELPLGTYYVFEKTPPVGYVHDPTPYKVDITYEGQNVEVVRRNTSVSNKVIEGQIAIVKHTDESGTQIEQPLEGAIFDVYLKSAGSYDKAKSTERDILTTPTKTVMPSPNCFPMACIQCMKPTPPGT